mgnify:CR=1 FL=1
MAACKASVAFIPSPFHPLAAEKPVVVHEISSSSFPPSLPLLRRPWASRAGLVAVFPEMCEELVLFDYRAHNAAHVTTIELPSLLAGMQHVSDYDVEDVRPLGNDSALLVLCIKFRSGPSRSAAFAIHLPSGRWGPAAAGDASILALPEVGDPLNLVTIPQDMSDTSLSCIEHPCLPLTLCLDQAAARRYAAKRRAAEQDLFDDDADLLY